MLEAEEPCDHPMEFVRRVVRSVYECLLCEHTSFLIGRPYFCGKPGCEDVHTLTLEEKTAHVAQFHPTDKSVED